MDFRLINFKRYSLAFLFGFLLCTFAKKVYAVDNEYVCLQDVARPSIAFLNQGSDIVADRGVMAAVSSVSPNSTGKLSLFSAAYIGELKCKPDSRNNHIKLNTKSLIVGLARSFNIRFGVLTLGPFFENGVSFYDGYSDLSSDRLEKSNYNGGGLLGHIDFSNNFYSEFSSRIGFNQTRFVTEINNTMTKCDYRVLYIGYHTGAGYTFRVNNVLKLDTYSKYFFARRFSKDVYLNEDTFCRLSDINSQRIRLGTMASFIFSEHVTTYCGVAWEYATIKSVNIKNSTDSSHTLSGGNGIGELGISNSFKDFYFDLGTRCYIGEQKVISLMIRISFDLFGRIKRFLGYSTEKFYLESTKRFSRNFKMSKKDCFAKSLEIIKNLRARVTHKNFDKGYIVVFNLAGSFEGCCLDSTEAGIFIKETSSEDVDVEVCSDNSILGRKFSVKFFEMLIEKYGESDKNQDNKNNI